MKVYHQIIKDRFNSENPHVYSRIHRFYFPDKYLISIGKDSEGLYQELFSINESPELRKFSELLKISSGRTAIEKALLLDDLEIIRMTSTRMKFFEKQITCSEKSDKALEIMSTYLMRKANDSQFCYQRF